MSEPTPSRKEPTPRKLRQKAVLAYVVTAALLYFCLIDGNDGDTLGTVINGVGAIANLWMAMKLWTQARQREQSSPTDPTT
jgi:hypothetical protein